MIPVRPHLHHWLNSAINLCKPKNVCVLDGSPEQFHEICRGLVAQKIFVPLDVYKRPNSFWCRSTADDVARLEERTFICSKRKEDAGPTNNWRDPDEMRAFLEQKFNGSMEGRTAYVIPFSMGPIGSPFSHIGVEFTDSAYVAVNMQIMTRIGSAVLKALGDGPFVPCLHSVGAPLKPGQKETFWPSNPDKYIVHFPEERSIWSYGSGYGGNALLGKKGFALRIASVLGRDEGWMAEHMLIMGITNPKGIKKYFAAAFPSLCGKTNLAMLKPNLPGWKIECVGDDIAWMRFRNDGKLHAINPEAGFFGVAPGTSRKANPNAMDTLSRNTIFTNVALTDDGDVWWEGMTPEPPAHLIDWTGQSWTPGCGRKAAHPNARFTVPITQCPIFDPNWENPEGVPIDAIIFGGRRSNVVPLVREAFSWQHGVFLGSSITSEKTAAAVGEVGKLRHDPFAMLPFCGYNMGDYFSHWLKMGEGSGKILPRIFYVNWFNKGPDGKFLWPGFGENIRVLEWMFNRTMDNAPANTTPIGYVPTTLNLSGLNLPKENLRQLFQVDVEAWKKEATAMREYYRLFGNHLPTGLMNELTSLERHLKV